MHSRKILFRIRAMLVFFMIALLLSGITAFPVWSELRWLMESGEVSENTLIGDWLHKVWLGVSDAQQREPFIFYGFDWLAFAHLVIALIFIGPFRDPVRNKWVIQWGMLACLAIIPLALIAGPVRGIPWVHILIDCSFGIFGLIPLGLVLRWIGQLEAIKSV
ncbi:MAG TPA: hypothetical protein VK563_15055 [Puia sp.]|nr:hypothetical protein [Puia sp.]